jgi:hypothetical protein
MSDPIESAKAALEAARIYLAKDLHEETGSNYSNALVDSIERLIDAKLTLALYDINAATRRSQ